MTYREAIDLGEKLLTEADIVDAKTDAWMLLEWTAKINRSFYYMHMNDEIPKDRIAEFEAVLRKRAKSRR